jgi:hypothetical protein
MRAARPLPTSGDFYRPDLPREDWERIRAFVLESASVAAAKVSYPEPALFNAIAHHVDWCVNIAGLPMTRDVVFRRDVIGAAAAVVPTTYSSTRGRRRSLLLRVGEALDIIPAAVHLPPLAASSPTAPYTTIEIDEITRWALNQPEEKRSSARALVAMGLGAGLPSRELSALRAMDVLEEGARVQVEGVTARVVPVDDPWAAELGELVATAIEKAAPLFRPTVAWHKNLVTNFIATSIDDGLRPTVQRMRSTWLVEQLSKGVPMQDLLSAAGLQSMDALVRYEKFLPPPAPVVRGGTPR